MRLRGGLKQASISRRASLRVCRARHLPLFRSPGGRTGRRDRRRWSDPPSRLTDDAFQDRIEFVKLRRVPAPPVTKRHDDWLEAEPERGRNVVDPRRHLPEDFALEQTVLLHLTELLDKDFLAGIWRKPLQLGKPLRSIEQVIEDDRLPASGDHLERAFCRQL